MHKQFVNDLSNNEQSTPSLSSDLHNHLSSRRARSPQPEAKLQQSPTADKMGWDCLGPNKGQPTLFNLQ